MEFATINLAVGVVGVVLFFLGITKNGKSRRSGQTMLWLGIALAAVAFALPLMGVDVLGNIDLSGIGQTGTTIGLPSSTANEGFCPYDGVTVTLSAVNAYTGAAAGGTHRYSINGAPAKTGADASTLDTSAGASIEVLFMNGSSSSGYLSSLKTFTVPCEKTPTLSEKVYGNQTLTIRVFNEEGNLITTTGENETVGAVDTANLQMDVQGTYQKGFPYGMIAIVEYNSSAFDDIQVQLGGSKTEVPSFYTVSSVGNKAVAYTVPALLSNEKISGTLYVDVDDTDNPGDTIDPTIKFYALNPFVDNKNGGGFESAAVETTDDEMAYGHMTSYTVSVD